MKNKLITFFLFLYAVVPSINTYSQSIKELHDKIVSRKETLQSLFIEIYYDTTALGTATGFVIQVKSHYYLITNYHVVTNKSPIDGTWLNPKLQVTPNRIKIVYNLIPSGIFVRKEEKLLSAKGDTLWFHWPIGKEMVDVVALQLSDISGAKIYPVEYTRTIEDVVLSPTSRVFIPGFPLGLKSYRSFPIWKSGYLASEQDFGPDNKPIILVDDIPFPGMSGSPVYYFGNEIIHRNGSSEGYVNGLPESIFVGVFSHGNRNGVYGALWKGDFLKTLFDKLP